MKTVKFLRACQQGTLYNKDEVASFDGDVAKRLIDQKFAEPYKPSVDEPKPAPAA